MFTVVGSDLRRLEAGLSAGRILRARQAERIARGRL